MKLELLIFFILLLFSCESETNNKSNIVENQSLNNNVSIDFVKTFEGQINDEYPIIAKIESNGGKISGKYYYLKQGKEELDLKGTIDESGLIKMSEYDENDNQTGLFVGKLVNENKLKGKWSKPNGNKSMPFYLLTTNTSYKIFQEDLKKFISVNGTYEHILNDGGIYIGNIVITNQKNEKFDFEIITGNKRGCTGMLNGVGFLKSYNKGYFSSKSCENLSITFQEEELTIKEKNCTNHGMGCGFSGNYKKKSE